MSLRQRLRRRYKWIVATFCGLASAAITLASDGTLGTDRFLFDLSLASHHALGINQRNEDNLVAVVAIDERTLEAPELRHIPRVFFGRAFANMLNAVFDAGALAVGLDVLFAYDSTRFDPKLGAPFRKALVRHGDRVVLGRSARATPAIPILLAVPDDAVAFLELPRDPDGVTRRVPAAYPTVEGERVPTLAARLVERAGGTMPGPIRLTPAWHLETLPTYALIDVLRCAESPAEMVAAFAGKVILVGSTLPEEDRRLSPSRFIAPPVVQAMAAEAAGGCRLDQLGASDPDSPTVPGVFLHAAAVEAALASRNVTVASAWEVATLSGFAAVVGAIFAVNAAPTATLAALVLGIAALATAGGALLAVGFWFPASIAAVSLPVSAGFGYTARFLMEERRRRWIQQIFGHYLAPRVVDKLASDEKLPELGGERREVTVMFADLSGFTALSGRVPPRALMEASNRYLALIAEEVEHTGGYVDKFIGDAVMAIWGAPVGDPSHARSAVSAGLAISERMVSARTESVARGEEGFWLTIGMNSGPAIVGNVGSPKRLAYTVVGETVNLAARFESVPGDYACMIVIGEGTAKAVDGPRPVCELDLIKVKGKAEPVRIYEPFAAANGAVADYAAGYARALAAYRERRFSRAQQHWLSLHYPGPIDPKRLKAEGGVVATPNRVMAARAAAFIAEPPPEDWGGEWERESN
jgi:adenylate cyclase